MAGRDYSPATLARYRVEITRDRPHRFWLRCLVCGWQWRTNPTLHPAGKFQTGLNECPKRQEHAARGAA